MASMCRWKIVAVVAYVLMSATVQVGVDIQDRDHALFVRHSDVVELDVDVLRPLLVERVLDQVDGALVILVDRRRLILRLVEEVRQLT
eukprot:CAMPEP_0179871118 /NCGR_PEP_ID=MMETSP0982-20121206/20677_1 /TAXON_ID=483367 /ORGANISM="non described non described, Strain CCMP 2436" /LENGTH=87 /DNA_ID=CAMNT_0021761811 /DNA_START=116 /DNA_END=378 /DNA_ORIENTATION=-